MAMESVTALALALALDVVAAVDVYEEPRNWQLLPRSARETHAGSWLVVLILKPVYLRFQDMH